MSLIFSEDFAGATKGAFDTTVDTLAQITYAGGKLVTTKNISNAPAYVELDSGISDKLVANMPHVWGKLTVNYQSGSYSATRNAPFAMLSSGSAADIPMLLRFKSDGSGNLTTMQLLYDDGASVQQTITSAAFTAINDDADHVIEFYFESIQGIAGDAGVIKVYMDDPGRASPIISAAIPSRNGVNGHFDTFRVGLADTPTYSTGKIVSFDNVMLSTNGDYTDQEETYYISPNGNNQNTGQSEAQAWKSARIAGFHAKAGDTIIGVGTTKFNPIRANTLINGAFQPKRSGAVSSFITINGNNQYITNTIHVLGDGSGQFTWSGPDGNGEYVLYETGVGNVTTVDEVNSIAFSDAATWAANGITSMTKRYSGTNTVETTVANSAVPYTMTRTASYVERVTASVTGTLTKVVGVPAAGEYQHSGNTIVTNAAQDGETLTITYIAIPVVGSLLPGEYAHNGNNLYYKPLSGQDMYTDHFEIGHGQQSIDTDCVIYLSTNYVHLKSWIGRNCFNHFVKEEITSGNIIEKLNSKYGGHLGVSSTSSSSKIRYNDFQYNRKSETEAYDTENGGGIGLIEFTGSCYGNITMYNADDGIDTSGNTSNCDIYGNLSCFNGLNSKDACGIEVGIGTGVFRVNNNTTIGNRARGVSFASTGLGELKNNIIFDNGIYDIYLADEVGDKPSFVTLDIATNCVFGAPFGVRTGGTNGEYNSVNDVNSDPLLSDDYSLKANSPCVGAGTDGLGNYVGADGEPFPGNRGWGWDIGGMQSKHNAAHPTKL